MGWELLDFFGFEGLDKRICWGFCGLIFLRRQIMHHIKGL
jgi:hypothetical protein